MKTSPKFFSTLLLACMLTICTEVSGQTNGWGKTNYRGHGWVENKSRPFEITKGLDGRHLALWASHGIYYDAEKMIWKWQRPNLFCTTEDLFTQTIVVPYLMKMLENAGANVFSPRERESLITTHTPHPISLTTPNGFPPRRRDLQCTKGFTTTARTHSPQAPH